MVEAGMRELPNMVAFLLTQFIATKALLFTPKQLEEILIKINKAFPPIEVP